MTKNWKTKKLKNVCDKITDGSHNPPKGKEDGLMMLSGRNILENSLDYSKVRYITEEEFCRENKRTDIMPGDVLLSIVGTIGRSVVFPSSAPKVVFQRSVAVLKLQNFIDPHFLCFAFKSPKFQTLFNNKARGVAQKGIYLKTIREIEFTYPSLEEQKRIVSILNKAFTVIDKAKANTEQNLKNTKELFDSYLQGVFENKGSQKNVKPLKDLCNNFKSDIVDGPFGSNMKRADYTDYGVPVLKIQNIKPFNIELKNMDFVTQSKYVELKRHSYKKGDIIMTKLGNPLGASAIVKDIDDGIIVADLVRIRAQKINTSYLCYHLNSTITNNFINSQQKGATRPRVKISVVRNLPIYAPSLLEQESIVKKLDALSSKIEKLKTIYQKKLDNLEELKKSILQKAFSGELNTEKELEL